MPTARVVKQGARRVPQPTFRDGMRSFMTPSERTRTVLYYVVGLWPLIVAGGLAIALLWSAGYQQP